MTMANKYLRRMVDAARDGATLQNTYFPVLHTSAHLPCFVLSKLKPCTTRLNGTE